MLTCRSSRQLLKHAIRQEWIKYLPQFPTERIEHSSPDLFDQDQLTKLITTSQNRLTAEGSGNARSAFNVNARNFMRSSG